MESAKIPALKLIAKFNIKSEKTTEGLKIEAEDLTFSRLFSTVIARKSSIKTFTDNVSFELDAVHDIISKKAFHNSEASSLSLTEDGKLIYKREVKVGNVSSISGFCIELKLVQVDEYIRLSCLVEKLSLKVSRLEDEANNKKNEELEQIVKANNERFIAFQETVLKKLQGLENIVHNLVSKQKEQNQGEHIICTFNPKGEFASMYKLSEYNTSAITKEMTHYTIFAEKPLPLDKKCRFTMLILKAYWVMIGIAPEESLKERIIFQNKAAICFAEDGSLFIEGTTKSGFPKFVTGDKISFEVDLKTGVLTIGLNGNMIYAHTIGKQNLEHRYYPFLFTQLQAGSGAKFI